MTPSCRHTVSLGASALLSAMATVVSADALETFVEDRTRLFSEVCMASAPAFEALESTALAAGFEKSEGRLKFNEVLVSLKPSPDGTLCACQMTMLAPDFPLLLVTMVERLRADYPEWRHDDSLGGKGYSAYFTREGEDVVLELSPEKFEDHDMLVGWVVARRTCPV